MTTTLNRRRYWPSYNMPWGTLTSWKYENKNHRYFPDVYEDSATAQLADKYGDWFTYDKNPRALIFKRDEKHVQDIDSMRKLMRYDDNTDRARENGTQRQGGVIEPLDFACFCARRILFTWLFPTVTLNDFYFHLSRSNDYTRDPLSRCDCDPPYSAENAISCRSDLNPKNGTYPFEALAFRDHAATDVKVTLADSRGERWADSRSQTSAW